MYAWLSPLLTSHYSHYFARSQKYDLPLWDVDFTAHCVHVDNACRERKCRPGSFVCSTRARACGSSTSKRREPDMTVLVMLVLSREVCEEEALFSSLDSTVEFWRCNSSVLSLGTHKSKDVVSCIISRQPRSARTAATCINGDCFRGRTVDSFEILSRSSPSLSAFAV